MSTSPIRLGVVGLGRAFSLMLPTFLQDRRIRLVAACDPREEARAQFARDFEAPVYERFEDLADDASPEVIYIASPHQLHAEHTRIAALHGKHVLVEKPMALSLEDCDQMIEACAAADVHMIVGHCHSFDSPYLEAEKIIRSGEFGQVRMILAVNYTDFLYRPRRPEELVTESGGGVIFSQAAHQFDIVRLLAGSNASSVRAAVGAWDSTRPADGAYASLLWFENGAFASLNYSGYAHFDSDAWSGDIDEFGETKAGSDYGAARRRLRAVASPAAEAALKNARTYGGSSYNDTPQRGPRRTHQHFGSVIVSCEGADLLPAPDGVWVYDNDGRSVRQLPTPTVPRVEVIDELDLAIRHGRPPTHNGHWGKGTLEICLALIQSSRDQCEVTLRHQ